MAINRSVGQQRAPSRSALPKRSSPASRATVARAIRYLNALARSSGPHSGRDLADAVHLLCSLHGRYPGLIEIALQRCPKGRGAGLADRAHPKRSSASGSISSG